MPSKAAARRREALIALLVALCSTALAFVYMQRVREQGFTPSFYQSAYEPAVRMACGEPFGVDARGGLSPEMIAFLKVEREALSCEAVRPAAALDTSPPTRAWYHLLATIGSVWRVTGISWGAVDGVAASMMGLAATFLYALFRLWMPVPVAVVLVALSIRPALPYLSYFRDFNKAPFILGAIFVAALLASRSLPKGAFLAIMAAIGLWLGVGYGFRPDVLIGLPLLAATAVFFRPGPIEASWRLGLVGALVLCGAFALAASPVLLAFRDNLGSCHWHFALLGLSDIHSAALDLGPGPISWLPFNEDGMAWRTVATYADRAMGLSQVGFCTPDYDEAGRALYRELAATFPADFIARAAAAIRHVVAYGFLGMPGLPSLGAVGAWIDSNRGLVQSAWLVAWFAVFFLLLVRETRQGLFAIFAVTYLCAYPMVQFDARHYFHLAFLAWIPAGLAVDAVLRSTAHRRKAAPTVDAAPVRPPWGSWARAAGLLGALAVATIAIYATAREIQAKSVSALLERYRAAPGEPVAEAESRLVDGRLRISLVAPISADRGAATGRMLRLDIGSASCPARPLTVTLALGGSEPALAFRRQVPVAVPPGENRVVVFAPVYLARDRLDKVWLEFAGPDRACLAGARWLDPAALPPLWVGATISGGA